MGAPLGPWDPRMLVAKQREVRVKQERYPEDVWFGPSIFVDISVVCRVYRYSWWNLTLGDWCPLCQSNSPCFVGKTQRFGRWSCWSKSLIANLCGQLLGARWSIWSLSMPIAPIQRPCESLNSRKRSDGSDREDWCGKIGCGPCVIVGWCCGYMKVELLVILGHIQYMGRLVIIGNPSAKSLCFFFFCFHIRHRALKDNLGGQCTPTHSSIAAAARPVPQINHGPGWFSP